LSSPAWSTPCDVPTTSNAAWQNTDVPQDKRIEFRIGIHLGDIIIADDGDGVNIAVRLEGIAEPGGICISDDAHRQVRGKVESTLEDMGSQSLKNIAEPMRAWRVRIGPSSSPATKTPTEIARPLALPDKPSIAVLPFENFCLKHLWLNSRDDGDGYFVLESRNVGKVTHPTGVQVTQLRH